MKNVGINLDLSSKIQIPKANKNLILIIKFY